MFAKAIPYNTFISYCLTKGLGWWSEFSFLSCFVHCTIHLYIIGNEFSCNYKLSLNIYLYPILNISTYLLWFCLLRKVKGKI